MTEAQKVEQAILGRLLYCRSEKYCHAGGRPRRLCDLHPNYGLPCVGGTITYEDGTEVFSSRCVFCGSTQ